MAPRRPAGTPGRSWWALVPNRRAGASSFWAPAPQAMPVALVALDMIGKGPGSPQERRRTGPAASHSPRPPSRRTAAQIVRGAIGKAGASWTAGDAGAAIVGVTHADRRAGMASAPSSSASTSTRSLPHATRPEDIGVEIVGDTYGARAFWEAFAAIAADLLEAADGGDLLGSPEETIAA